MKVVILSAGQGRRLLPLTEARPKCLVPLAGMTLLEWQLRHLAEVGVEEAVVVTGFAAEQVDATAARFTDGGMRVRTLYNPFFSLTDNLASCWIARQEMTGPFLLLNGDTLFEPAVAERLLLADEAPITLAIDRKPRYDADDMKVIADDLSLRSIGKTLDGPEVNGESIGFLRFSEEGAALFRAEIESLMRTPEGLKLWYLSVIDRLAKETGRVQVSSVEGLDWAEVDFVVDYRAAKLLTERWLAEQEGDEAQEAS